MKHKAFFIFMTALLIGSPLYAQKYKIALIHSYQEGYSGAGIVNKLFVKGLKDQQIDFQLRTFYLDCEKHESVEENALKSIIKQGTALSARNTNP